MGAARVAATLGAVAGRLDGRAGTGVGPARPAEWVVRPAPPFSVPRQRGDLEIPQSLGVGAPYFGPCMIANDDGGEVLVEVLQVGATPSPLVEEASRGYPAGEL